MDEYVNYVVVEVFVISFGSPASFFCARGAVKQQPKTIPVQDRKTGGFPKPASNLTKGLLKQ